MSWQRLVPACVLLLGVAVQAVRILALELSPQGSGPGFAMFSRTDTVQSRFLRLHGATDGDPKRLQRPREVSPEEYRFRTLPSADNGEELARSLLRERWVAHGDRFVPASQEHPPGAVVQLSRVRVELWRVALVDGALVPERMRTLEVSRDD